MINYHNTVFIIVILFSIYIVYKIMEYYKYQKYKQKYIVAKYVTDNNENGNLNIGINKITAKLSSTLGKKNQIFSPLSITMALSILHNAPNIDFFQLKLRDELDRFFEYQYNVNQLVTLNKIFNKKTLDVTCQMANILIIKQQSMDIFTNQYLTNISQFVKVEFIKKRYVNVDILNKYIEEKTNGMIQKLLSSSDINNALFVIVNTIYFKANWKFPFDNSMTKKKPFYKNDDEIIVDMMFQNESFPYFENKELQMIELPYVHDYAMGIILFKRNMKNITSSEIINLLNFNLNMTKIKLYIPRFKQRNKYILNNSLKKIGLDNVSDQNLFKIIHEAVVVVNEEGTEASAATAVVSRTLFTEDIIFNANKPFIYYIRHLDTNIILFYGIFDGTMDKN